MSKLKLGALLSIIGVTAFADSGAYVGVSAGYGTINSSTTNGFSFVDGAGSKSGGTMAGGIFAGYDFNRYLGIQADYDYIANVNYSTGNNPLTGTQGSINASQQILDLGIVGHLPFGLFANALSGLSIFGKLAVGYTTTSFDGGTVVSTGSAGQNSVSVPSNASSMVPVLGLGAEYGWNTVGLRAEYDYIGNTTVTNNSQTLMNTNNGLVLLSVFYHF